MPNEESPLLCAQLNRLCAAVLDDKASLFQLVHAAWAILWYAEGVQRDQALTLARLAGIDPNLAVPEHLCQIRTPLDLLVCDLQEQEIQGEVQP